MSRVGAVYLAAFRLACRLYPTSVRALFAEDMAHAFQKDLTERMSVGPQARLGRCSAHARATLFAFATLAAVLADALAARCRSLAFPYRVHERTDTMFALAEDFVAAVRSLRRSPGFTLATALTLALTIGAGTAVLSVVHSVLLRPLPYADPDRVVVLWERNVTRGSFENVVHPLNLEAWRGATSTLESFAAIYPASYTLDGGQERYRAAAVLASPAFFPLLGVEPALGRWPTREEAGARVVLLSHPLWRDRFGSDAEVVGRSISMQGEPFTVVGVMPESFRPLRIGWIQEQELWVPLDPTEGIGGRALIVLARLREGVTHARATEEMTAIAARLAATEARNEGWDVQVVGLHEQVVGGVSDLLWTLLAAVALVLLIACTNVGGLVLARTHRRRGEFAVRAALGAGARRITRQLMVECAVLVLTAVGTGALIGAWILGAARPLLPASLPRLAEVGLEAGAAVAVSCLALALVQLTSVVPALRLDLAGRRGPLLHRAAVRSRVRHGLIVGQIAFALVLAVGAGLVLRSFRNLTAVDLGFEPDDATALRITLGASATEPAHRAEIFGRILERVQALPEVASAGAVSVRPLGGLAVATRVWAAEASPEPDEGSPSASVRQATPGYLEAAGIRLTEGRDFGALDRAGEPLRAIVSESLARTLWPEGGWLGRTLGVNLSDGLRAEVVGVVEHVRYEAVEEEGRPSVLLAFAQSPQSSMDLVARGSDGMPGVAPLRRAITEVEPSATIYRVSALEENVAAASADRRFGAILLGGFSLLSLLLTAVGVYGVVAGDVSSRRFEIAVRLALGARAPRLLVQVMQGSLLRAALGVLLGLAGGVLAMPLLETVLFDVSPTDTATYAAVSGVLLGVAALATLIPALKALRFDPAWTMRPESS